MSLQRRHLNFLKNLTHQLSFACAQELRIHRVLLIRKSVSVHRQSCTKKNIRKYVMTPANAIARHPFVEERTARLAEFSNTSSLNRVEKGMSQSESSLLQLLPVCEGDFWRSRQHLKLEWSIRFQKSYY